MQKIYLSQLSKMTLLATLFRFLERKPRKEDFNAMEHNNISVDEIYQEYLKSKSYTQSQVGKFHLLNLACLTHHILQVQARNPLQPFFSKETKGRRLQLNYKSSIFYSLQVHLLP
jgi:hypothetical protein